MATQSVQQHRPCEWHDSASDRPYKHCSIEVRSGSARQRLYHVSCHLNLQARTILLSPAATPSVTLTSGTQQLHPLVVRTMLLASQ